MATDKIGRKEFFMALENEGYTKQELKHLFHVVRHMDKKVRKWVIDWFGGKGYPKDRIEGVTVMDLVEKQGLKPLNAFIVMNWLLTDPDAAKYSLTRPGLELMIDEITKKEILEQMEPIKADLEADSGLFEGDEPIEEITGE